MRICLQKVLKRFLIIKKVFIIKECLTASLQTGYYSVDMIASTEIENPGCASSILNFFIRLMSYWIRIS